MASLDRSQITGFGTLAYIFILNKLKGCGLETNNLHLHLDHMIQSSKTSCFYNCCLHSKFLLKNKLRHSLQSVSPLPHPLEVVQYSKAYIFLKNVMMVFLFFSISLSLKWKMKGDRKKKNRKSFLSK